MMRCEVSYINAYNNNNYYFYDQHNRSIDSNTSSLPGQFVSKYKGPYSVYYRERGSHARRVYSRQDTSGNGNNKGGKRGRSMQALE